MTYSSEFLSTVCITDVWHALGGGEIKRNRARAFWRPRADGWSVSINPTKGCWYDHRDGQGGGILDLIETALSCDRSTAIEWARDFAGVPRPGMTAQAKRDYARRRAAAEIEAEQLVAWRGKVTETLREWHDLNLRLYHCSKYAILNAHYSSDDELAAWMDEAEQADREWQRGEATLDCWRSASWDNLLKLFRRRRRRYAA